MPGENPVAESFWQRFFCLAAKGGNLIQTFDVEKILPRRLAFGVLDPLKTHLEHLRNSGEPLLHREERR
jgi:hypothetical protein